jgi:DNA processing protein
MEPILPWLSLKSVPGVGNLLFKRLLERFGSPAAVLAAPVDELLQVEGVSRSLSAGIAGHRAGDSVKKDIDRVLKSNVQIITMNDTDYPRRLRQIVDPPPVLYVKGRLRSDADCIAVVGSRHATPYGLANATRLGADLARRGLSVVSGMALGIDTAAHQGALQGGGATIAVLGSGFDHLYPAQNRALARAIVENGAVITEFPMQAEPEPHHFPARNRVISGMSLGTVVVEATRKSGSLITARLAADQNREVFAVPGSVRSFKSTGTHTLIKQGAKLVENVQDILDELAPLLKQPASGAGEVEQAAEEPPALPLSRPESELLKALDPYPVHIDQLIRQTGLAPATLSHLLLQLELKGLVQQAPGKWFSRVRH